MVLLLVLSGVVLAGAVATFVAASWVVYLRLSRFGKRPIFSMLSMPGYLVTFCRREHYDSSYGIAVPLRIVSITQVVMLISIVIFGVLISTFVH